MKQLLFLLILIGFTSCSSNVKVNEKQTTFTIDSVEYHGTGHDNTLQIDPYWKLHLKECNMWTRSHFRYDKGDTIVVSVRKIEKPTAKWYNYTH
jgi:hypothetical protein